MVGQRARIDRNSVARIASRSTVFPGCTHGFHRLRSGLLWTCLLLVVGICAPRLASAADTVSATIAPAGSGLTFAIADFDGDRHPDVASIQSGRTNSSSTNDYWVQVRLSGSAASSFRLVGPKGGLRIEARDVNGDHAVDLVLSTAWLRRPVVVLLNDGHGSFQPVAPTAFPAAFRKSNSNWKGTARQPLEAARLSQEFRAGMWGQASSIATAQPDGASIHPPAVEFAPVYLLGSCAGRAPPANTL